MFFIQRGQLGFLDRILQRQVCLECRENLTEILTEIQAETFVRLMNTQKHHSHPYPCLGLTHVPCLLPPWLAPWLRQHLLLPSGFHEFNQHHTDCLGQQGLRGQKCLDLGVFSLPPLWLCVHTQNEISWKWDPCPDTTLFYVSCTPCTH